MAGVIAAWGSLGSGDDDDDDDEPTDSKTSMKEKEERDKKEREENHRKERCIRLKEIAEPLLKNVVAKVVDEKVKEMDSMIQLSNLEVVPSFTRDVYVSTNLFGGDFDIALVASPTNDAAVVNLTIMLEIPTDNRSFWSSVRVNIESMHIYAVPVTATIDDFRARAESTPITALAKYLLFFRTVDRIFKMESARCSFPNKTIDFTELQKYSNAGPDKKKYTLQIRNRPKTD